MFIKSTQHCTASRCGYSLNHTAAWCGTPQLVRCGCAWCYPHLDTDPPLCDDCGHFHQAADYTGCPDKDQPCGSYACCAN